MEIMVDGWNNAELLSNGPSKQTSVKFKST